MKIINNFKDTREKLAWSLWGSTRNGKGEGRKIEGEIVVYLQEREDQ